MCLIYFFVLYLDGFPQNLLLTLRSPPFHREKFKHLFALSSLVNLLSMRSQKALSLLPSVRSFVLSSIVYR